MNKQMWVIIAILAGVIGGGLWYRYMALDVDSRGATRLMRALEENDTQLARELLEQGTDISAQDKSGQTALFYVARHADEPALLYKLLVAGADPLAKDKQGYTPLMRAAEFNGSARMVKALAKQGGFSHAQTVNKNKALLVAARHNQLGVIKTLLGSYADPSVAGEDGKTASDLLTENEHLSTQEKNDLRQAMLVLEILQARERFKKTTLPNKWNKKEEKIISKDLKATSKTPLRTPQEKPMLPLAPQSEISSSAIPATATDSK